MICTVCLKDLDPVCFAATYCRGKLMLRRRCRDCLNAYYRRRYRESCKNKWWKEKVLHAEDYSGVWDYPTYQRS